jgi:predicted permease
MIKNYFKTAFRNLKRNKSYAFINILGLAVGIAACLLIFLVIRFEKSFDNFHLKKDHIYRVGTEFHSQDGVGYSGGVSFPVGPALKIDFPQLKEVARIFKMGDGQISLEENNQLKKFNEPNIFFTEPEFFKLFDFAWITGNPKTVLDDPNSAALTQDIAVKYFGDWHSAIGKIIKINNKQVYKVGGILKNIPANTDFPLDVVLPFVSLKNYGIGRNMEDWISTFGQASCFVVLPGGYSQRKFNADLAVFAKKHKPAEYAEDRYVAQPLMEIHYDDRFGNYRNHTFSKSLITALTLIGIFLLVIACVNFINLATAQAVNRSKEVGVRKVLGSNRGNLALQFLSETFLITIVALMVAVAIAYTGLPFLNELLAVKMAINFFDSSLILFLLITILLVTVLSGLYPAIILSGFNPITALKSKITNRMVGGISLRRALVILQFAIAHVLIIGTLIVVSQMNFFRNATLGFDKAAILNVQLPGDSISRTKFDFLKNRLSQNTDITSVSFSGAVPADRGNWDSDFKFDHATKNTDFSAHLKWADVDYFKTYNLQFVAGRPYYPGDTVREIVVNETLLRKLGVADPKQALGKEINFWDGQMIATIVGVIRDFNSNSLKEPMSAVILGTWKNTYNTINIKIRQGKEKSTLAFTEKIWNEVYPDYVYQYRFLDASIAEFYKQENQLSHLYKIFAFIAILISCLGLYGLVSFMAAQKTKEVGIRKVLGATAGHIVYLLSKEFSLLIIIAFVIAGPIAYYIMHKWLQNYTYRIQLGATVFVLAIVGSMIIAWITVGHRAIKAAIANPVKSLRTE